MRHSFAGLFVSAFVVPQGYADYKHNDFYALELFMRDAETLDSNVGSPKDLKRLLDLAIVKHIAFKDKNAPDTASAQRNWCATEAMSSDGKVVTQKFRCALDFTFLTKAQEQGSYTREKEVFRLTYVVKRPLKPPYRLQVFIEGKVHYSNSNQEVDSLDIGSPSKP